MENSKPKRKWNIPLKLDAISQSVKQNPKAFSDTKEFGKTLWVEATEWEDGGLSIGNYNAETKTNFKLGSGKPKVETQPTNNHIRNEDAPQQKQFASNDNDWNI